MPLKILQAILLIVLASILILAPDKYWGTIFLTLKLALATTTVLLIVGLPVAYWLAFSRSAWKPIVESCITLPLVLPPVVLGFYLLLLFGRESWLGQNLAHFFSVHLVFTFEGLVVASVIYNLPFMIFPLYSGFRGVDVSYIEASYTLGKDKWQTLYYIILPNIKGAILAGVVLSFAHSIGEFGVVLMIGGDIPGVTRVASIAIYNEVQAREYAVAHYYSLILLLISFTVLLHISIKQQNND